VGRLFILSLNKRGTRLILPYNMGVLINHKARVQAEAVKDIPEQQNSKHASYNTIVVHTKMSSIINSSKCFETMLSEWMNSSLSTKE
jgi:hypothetical protein